MRRRDPVKRDYAPNKIIVLNCHKSYKVDLRYLEGLALRILDILNKKEGFELEFSFVNDSMMKKFNKKYTGEDCATDVLSFEIDKHEFSSAKLMGSIIISLDMAERNSRDFHTEFPDEVVLYMIHGVLHLFGYDDLNAPDAKRMEKKQYSILRRLAKCTHLSKALTPL